MARRRVTVKENRENKRRMTKAAHKEIALIKVIATDKIRRPKGTARPRVSSKVMKILVRCRMQLSRVPIGPDCPPGSTEINGRCVADSPAQNGG